jgi:hypothetical protein
MQVKTLRRHGYDRQRHSPGDIYEIENPKHVQILEAVKKIERVPEKAMIPAVSVEAPKPDPTPNRQDSKRQYKRRDMTAEN